ncbi:MULTISPECIES: hypothetical protein [Psychrobacter]|uniref:hypothetical protein n=1 Tax=Psychrobacter TaxID=497 RepID=UPI0007F466D7|nr:MULTISPECIES: hypothetical protein [Psychrobacter]MBK3393092.1 hypothetical protein [Psychrobacter sp. M9-54-1]OAP71118.1 hypothetical protein A7325_11705 [Psychrobacter sp. SHUES1]
MNFYEPNSDEYYLESDEWATDRQMLVKENCDLLKVEQANQFNLEHFFVKGNNDIKPTPNQNFNYFTLPYELGDELDNGLDAGDICMKIIEENLKGDILIASTDRDKCCFIQCSTVNESVIYQLGQIHINTPFIIFDNTQDLFLLIDFDLPLQIIGYKHDIIDSHGYIRENIGVEGWQTIFRRYGSYVNMPMFFKQYYYFLLPEIVKRYLADKK